MHVTSLDFLPRSLSDIKIIWDTNKYIQKIPVLISHHLTILLKVQLIINLIIKSCFKAWGLWKILCQPRSRFFFDYYYHRKIMKYLQIYKLTNKKAFEKVQIYPHCVLTCPKDFRVILPNVFWNVGFGVSGARLTDCVMGPETVRTHPYWHMPISQHPSPLGWPHD